MSGFAINLNILNVPANAIRHSVSILSNRAGEDPTLDIGYANIPTSLPPGCTAQSDQQAIMRELYINLKRKQP